MLFEGVTLDLLYHGGFFPLYCLLPILGGIYFKCVTFTGYLISSRVTGIEGY